MKKWDDDCRLKKYVNGILNAKPQIADGMTKSNLKKISRETDFSSHASCRSDKSDIKDSLLYKQLSQYSLQQYANKLMLRGYGQGLSVLANMNVEYQNQVLDEIRLLPGILQYLLAGHKKKFQDLFKYLLEPNQIHHVNTKGIFTPDNQSVSKKMGTGQVSYGRFGNTREFQHDILVPINRRSSQKHFSPYRDTSQQKPKRLPKLSNKKSIARNTAHSRQDDDDLTQIQTLNKRQDTLQRSQISKSTKKTLESQVNEQKPNNQLQMSNQKPTRIPRRSCQDDILLIQEYQGSKQVTKLKQNKLIKNLNKISGNIDGQMNLQLDQIKLMYQSFDNGKLASTLINLDMEELCNCFACLCQQKIEILIFNGEDSYDQDFEQPDDENNNSNLLPIQEQTFEISKQDNLNQELAYRNNICTNLDEEEQLIENVDNNHFLEEQESKYFEMSKSYFSVETTQVLDDKELFKRVFDDKSLGNIIPTAEVISNYCKNIMITTKMEREVAILSLIYLERLTKMQPIKLTSYNWQKTIFTSLILASKIWDDESFENNNFAKVMPQFTTVQINEMEKVFLKLIDYNLYIKQGDYARCYFQLRSFADKKKRSFPIKQLDLTTVLHLQKKVEQLISKQQFMAPLNKSF